MKTKTILIALIVLLITAAAVYELIAYTSGKSGGQSPAVSTTGNTKTFDITAKKFEFTPSQITVKTGDKVIINLTSLDVTHGFAIAGYGINKTVNPGATTTIEFIADKTGSFEFRCSVPCGEGHTDMKGTLSVR